LTELGAQVTQDPAPAIDTLVMGSPELLPSGTGRRYFAAAEGWIASVSPNPLPWSLEATTLAGVLAAGLGVSELFQARRGDPWAATRSLSLSLWDPAGQEHEIGPLSYALPERLWLVGLGHLGQAYAWVLGLLPYLTPNSAEFTLQDFDRVSTANVSTGLFCYPAQVGRRKTRVVGDALENAGFATRLIERPFDGDTRPQANEPRWALGGLDRVEPRRVLVDAGFSRYIDAGIGDDEATYLDIMVQTFPSGEAAADAFPTPQLRSSAELAPAYAALVDDQVQTGTRRGDAECGVITIADAAVGVAFVGVVAAVYVIADVLRALNGAQAEPTVLSLDLRQPQNLLTAATGAPRSTTNPGFVWVDRTNATSQRQRIRDRLAQ
jgi:hypothetical protein